MIAWSLETIPQVTLPCCALISQYIDVQQLHWFELLSPPEDDRVPEALELKDTIPG
jgi:hypothetical protein